MNVRLLIAVLAFSGLVGCAAPPPPPPHDHLFIDAAFKPPSVRINPDDALKLSPAMQHFADRDMRPDIKNFGPRDGLIEALYERGQLQLEYDSEVTRNAAEAFDARRGNCMSLVLMTAAFARYLNVPVSFNSVVLDESWTRFDGLFFVAGHVNITLSKPVMSNSNRIVVNDGEHLLIDFLPAQQLKGQRRRVIDEQTILAMYLNNRAAEALTKGAIDDAYWWSKAAIETDPRWLAAYNTLAVLYRRKGLTSQAEFALRTVLDREPLNTQALSNIVLVLNDQGRQAESLTYATQLAQVQPIPPYRFFDEGVAAMRAGDYAAANQLFRKEIARAAYVPEFHFWLALANYGMGDLSSAKGEIAKALENSATVKDKQLYGAKLAWLNQQRQKVH